LKTLFLSKLDTSNVTDMKNMFDACGGLRSLNLSTFDTSKVTDMSNMFYKCNNLRTLDVSKFNTKNVTNMAGMFARCNSLTALDLSSFDTGYVERMKEMFYICTKLRTIRVGFGKWTTANVLMDGGEDMFTGDVALVGGMGTKYDRDHTDKEYARIDDPAVPGYLTEARANIIEGSRVTPEAVELNEDKEKQVRSALSLPDTVEVFTLSDDSVVDVDAPRDIWSLNEEDAAVVSNDSEVPAAILQAISINRPGVLCFVTSLDAAVPAGAEMKWHSFPQSDDQAETETVSVSLTGDGSTAVFMKNGQTITTVPADHEVEVAAYFEEAGTYAPVITAATANGSSGGGGGGCDAGLGGMWLLFLIPVLAGKRP
nr:DUF285 domain-containing protein [Fretibacterium sp.]